MKTLFEVKQPNRAAICTKTYIHTHKHNKNVNKHTNVHTYACTVALVCMPWDATCTAHTHTHTYICKYVQPMTYTKSCIFKLQIRSCKRYTRKYLV